MIFRTLLFFVLMYLLVKVISRLFLAPSQNRKGRKSFMYHTFKNFSANQRPPNQPRRNSKKKSNGSARFDEIEEAEFEDVTDNKNSGAKSAD